MIGRSAMLVLLALASCTKEAEAPSRASPTPNPSAPGPTPMPPTPTSSALSAFTSLKGGSAEAIAPGDRIVALYAKSATWWDHDAPVTAELPGIPVEGSRWTADGKLHVGLGTLDLTTHTWQPESKLQIWDQPTKMPASLVAWLANGTHVAIVLGPPPQYMDKPTVAKTRELVIATVADGKPSGRHKLDLPGTLNMAAANDRVLVAGNAATLFDLDAKIIAGPDKLPEYTNRVRFGAGSFAMTRASGEVALVEPASGAVLASWKPATAAIDAVPVAGGVVAIDMKGTVYVGCVEHGKVRTTGEAAAGAGAIMVQLVGDRIVVSGAGSDPVRWATFTNPCH
jgi:hypothetical protein